MIDITPIAEAAVTLIGAVISLFLIPWLREKTGAIQQERIEAAVHIAVFAAEKLYGSGKGAQKLAYAEEYLESRGILLNTREVTARINAAIEEMDGLRQTEE